MRNIRCAATVCVALVAISAWTATADAATYLVAPHGTPSGDGSRQSPWDIASALGGARGVKPGDTLHLLGGTYRRRPKEQFEVKLAGAEGKPIHLRPAPGEHAVIDGGLAVVEPSAHLWVWDLEILVSEPHPKEPAGPGSHPEGFTRPWGGLNVHAGRHNKYINLVIHDCRQGVSWWIGDVDSELHGCVIYDNGWPATDRGHGHAIYTQNDTGVKTIANNIMTGGHAYTLHAYGSDRAFVNNYWVKDNIAYAAADNFLVGGGRASRGIRVEGNVLHGGAMRIGYGADDSEDCVVRDNLIVNGDLIVKGFRRPQVGPNRIIKEKDPRPDGVECRVIPNRYDPYRAHVAVLNWEKKPTLAVDLGPFLKKGDRYRVLDPRAVWGAPVAEGAYEGNVNLPVDGECAAFVVIRK
jgi:hypothetical protein